MLRAHVDDDPFADVGLGGRGDDLVPVLTADHDERVGSPALGRGVWCAHQLYALRSSGGGISAPWYSTGMPPNG